MVVKRRLSIHLYELHWRKKEKLALIKHSLSHSNRHILLQGYAQRKGIKNAGATYQRAMTKIFDEIIHKIVECYVDDLVVKAVSYVEHLQHLRILFDRLRQHALKLNPLKCAFMVSSGKFLGFVIRHRGIEIDPSKIKAILEMPPPQNLKELRSLQGRLGHPT